MVLLDASWWTGGNRQRGIGQYLSYFFEYIYESASSERVWLFPPGVSAREMADFVARFGGKSVALVSVVNAQDEIVKIIEQDKIQRVLIGSPFERPWSLLSVADLFSARKISWEAIIFDLLPAQHEKEILSLWPAKEQSAYRAGLSALKQADRLLAISPHTALQIEKLVQVSGDKIAVLAFGLTPDWLRPPVKGAPVKPRDSNRSIALTISGGEWRKNLAGTLEYFSKELARSHELFVICKLALQEHLKFRRIALGLDVYPLTRFLGQVSQRDKWRYLYSAQVFLFLSLAEGLGIPLLEARAAGIERIIISPELKKQGFDKLAPGCEVAKPSVRE